MLDEQISHYRPRSSWARAPTGWSTRLCTGDDEFKVAIKVVSPD